MNIRLVLSIIAVVVSFISFFIKDTSNRIRVAITAISFAMISIILTIII